MFALTLSALLALSLSSAAQVLKPRPKSPTEAPQGQTQKQPKIGGVQLGSREMPPEPGNRAPFPLTGDELYFRAEFGWGYRINLNEFTDISSRGPKSADLLGFSYRSDSVGVTLAHLYIHSMTDEFKDKSITEVFDLYSERALKDTAIIPESVNKRIVGPLYTLEYARREIWPMPDPENPGEKFDSLLVRHHSYAIAIRDISWLNIHLSKTELQPEDSLLFANILETVTFVEDVPAFPIIKAPASEAGTVVPLKDK